MRILGLVIWIGMYCCSSLYAQKVEREFRITQADFPNLAVVFLSQLDIPLEKVKWFKEVQPNKTSFEAKIKVEKHLYSIEFDSLGVLEDIEKLVKFKSISPDIQSVLRNSLLAELGKFKIVKTQVQFTGMDRSKIVLSELSAKNSTIRYEIELFTRKDASKRLMEYLVTSQGEILSAHEVIQRSSENLTY